MTYSSGSGFRNKITSIIANRCSPAGLQRRFGSSRLLGLLVAFSLVGIAQGQSWTNLIHRYSFTGGAEDSVGGAHGVLLGGAVLTNNAVMLDGANDYVDLPDNLIVSQTSVTFETWVTDQGSGNWARIWDFGADTTHYFFLSLPAGGGNLRAAMNSGAGEQIVEWPAGGRPPVSQQAHIVWTLDAGLQLARLYVNGAQVGTNAGFTQTPAGMGATINDWLGRSQFGGDPFFRGVIDEFRIYDGVLSDAEIQTSFEGGPDRLLSGPVYFVKHPQSQGVVEGQNVTLIADVGGTPPFSAQWFRNGLPLPGATNFTLGFIAALSNHNASFHIRATNVFNSVTYAAVSSNATLNVIADLTAPTLLRARSASTNGVDLVFSELLRPDSITNLANYSLIGSSGSVGITSVTLDPSGALLTLGTATLLPGSNYTVSVSGVRDVVGNLIAPGSQASFAATIYILRDIGAPFGFGTIIPTNGSVAVSAGGTGIGDTADQFSLAYQSCTGDFDVQVRLGSLGLSDLWATAGLMARDGLMTNAIFAASLATPGAAGSLFQSRAAVGAMADQTGSFPVNYPDTWLRLRRAGNVFSGYASLEGQTWSALGSVTMAASATLQVGLAVCSHNASQTTTTSAFNAGNVVFTNVANLALPFEPTGPSTRRTGLIISEILYHPQSGASTGSLEFVEIQNTDLIGEDLTGHRLTGSIDYTFPPGIILPSGGFLVVARDPAAVQSYYGISGVLGPFTNNLPNSTGTVRLRNELDGILLEVNYGSTSPWPVAADGPGHSLVLRRASYGENDSRAWAASDVIDGSPGQAEHFGVEPLRGVVINEVLAHTDAPDLDAIELFNNSSQPLNLSGCVLTDDADTNKFTIGNVTIPARGFVYFTENDLGFRLDAAGESIFLKNPAGTRVLDAVRFEAQENGVSLGRSRDGSEHWYRLSTRTFGATNSAPRISQIGINEIMYNPLSGDDELQYLEVYNRGPGAANLGGWKLMDGISYTFPSNTTITAGSYIVVANNAARLITNYANLNSNNTLGNFGGNLSHGGERIALAKPDTITTTNGPVVTTNRIDIVVDEVTYNDGGRWGKWSDGGGSSLELIDPRSDRRPAANWADSDESAKASWTLIERTALIALGMGNGTTGNGAPNRFEFFLQGPGECLVDEMEARSNGGANLISNPGFESGVTGWIFRGTQAKSTVQTGGAYSGANSLRVNATERGDTGANRIQTAITLMPVGGTNQATLRTRARWLRGDPNILLRVRGNWLECAGVMTVPTNLGTPGLPNSRLAANVGPAISEVAHAPVLPAANEPVVVTARVTDVDSVASVVLRYRLDPATTVISAAMRDDGTAGDTFANDGIYSATIPGQIANTLVAFFIQAQDGFGPSAMKLFPSDAPTRECLINFGEAPRAGSLGSYRIWVTESNLTYWAAREKNSNERLDATFIYGNSRIVYNAQTLYSGSPWHTPSYNGPLGAVCNYIVEFPQDDLFLGTTDFVLQGQATTESSTFNNDLTTQTEITAQWMARKIGLRPDYRRYVFVSLNGQARGMIYYDCQQPNSDIIDEYFSDDAEGHLHKIEDWFEFDDAGAGQSIITATLQDFEVGGQKRTERYRWTWRPRAVKGSPNEFEHLFALVDAVNATGPEPYTSATLNLVDIPQWARVFALEHMAGNWDSYGYERGKNMYTYKPIQSPWELLLWDVQLIFNKGGRPTTHSLFSIHDPAISRMLTHPPFLREYWGAFYDLVNGPMLPANYYPMMDARQAALLANGVSVQDPDSVKNWIDARRSYIVSQIPQAAFSVAGPGSFSSSSNSVTLTGVAPVNAGEILINGAAYPVTWTTATNWSVRVVLGAAGVNGLNVSAVDRAGNVISNAVVSVNYTGGVVAPEGNVVFNEIEYRPALDGAAFVELFNTHSTYTFDLSNWRVNGLDYNFPPGSILPPRSFLVLAENPTASSIAYGPTSLVFDGFNGSLDPDGETLTLFRPGSGTNEIVVDRMRYEAAAPWPVITNGASLQLVDAAQDNSRVANWKLGNSDVSGPQWVYVTATGNATSSSFYLYLQSAGDVYVDDLMMVSGSVAGVGANLFANGGFESALAGTWSASADFAQSVRSTSVAHSGAASLHVVATASGSGNNDSIQQTISPALVIGQPYTLSFWYLQSTNGGPLTMRLSSSGIIVSVNPAPSINGPLLATPFASNSVAAALPAFPSVWLNEVQVDNVTGPLDNFSQREPWAELRNSGGSPLNLGGFYLSDTYTNLTKWAFPSNATVSANGFSLVWCDNQTNQTAVNVPHAAFRPASGNGQMVLSRLVSNSVQIVDYLNYASLPANWSYGDVPDGQPFFRNQMFFVTPSGTNNGASAPITVFINEWLADNTDTLADPADGSFEDWFELYNPGTNVVDLGGYFLTDNLTNKFQFAVPNNGHYIIPPGGYLLVWADDETAQNSTNRADLHASFALGKGGEAIGLFAADGTTVDAVVFGAQTSDVSEGRFPNGAANVYAMPMPTPRTGNIVPNTSPTLTAISNRVVTLGQTLSFTANASDEDLPPQTLTFSLAAGAPAGAGINSSSGLFSWQPSLAPSTNTINVVVTDGGTPNLNAMQSFSVIVVPPPQLSGFAWSGNQFVFSWPTLAGQRFQVEYKDDLNDSVWTQLGGPLTATASSLTATNIFDGSPQRFFRLQVVP